MGRERSFQESTERPFLGLIFPTSLACSLGESAPPLEKTKDNEIKDQREESTFPADQHHAACEHRQEDRRGFRDDTGDSEPDVLELDRGAAVVAVRGAQGVDAEVISAPALPARHAV